MLGFAVKDDGLKKYESAVNNVYTTIKWAGAAVAALGMSFVYVAAKSEKSRMQWDALAGSSENAGKILKEIGEMSLKSPFSTGELKDAALTMIKFKVDTEKVIPVLKDMGNIAAVLGEDKLQTIAQAYGAIKEYGAGAGRMLMPLLREAPPLAEALAKEMGVTGAQLRKALQQGGSVSAEMFERALKRLSSQKGFADGMLKGAHTLTGMFTILKNIIHHFQVEIGKTLLPDVKDLVEWFIKLFLNNKSEIIKTLTAFFHKFAIIVAMVALILKQVIEDFGGLSEAGKDSKDVMSFLFDVITTGLKIIFQLRHLIYAIVIGLAMYKGVVLLASIAQWALNLAMTANPVGAVIVGFIALIAIIILAIKNWDKLKKKIYEVFDSIMKNPVLRAMMTIFAPFLTFPLLIIRNWDKIKKFFSDMWGSITNNFWSMLDALREGLAWIEEKLNSVGSVLGFRMGGGSSIGTSKMGSSRISSSHIDRINKNTNNHSTIKVNSTINMQVPEGTPQDQHTSIQKAAKDAVFKEWQSILRGTSASTPAVMVGE